MVVLLFLFLAFLPPRFQSTTIKANIKGQEIEINTKALSTTPEKAAAEFDARTDYVDSSRGFAFKRPSNSRWSDPKILHGLVELLAEKKVATSGPLKQAFEQTGESFDPVAEMVRRADIVRITGGKKVHLEITPSTNTELLALMIERILRISQQQQVNLDKDAVSKSIRESMGIDSADINNELNVYVLSKKDAKEFEGRLTMASLFVRLAPLLAAVKIDKPAADERSILSGLSETLTNVKVDGAPGDLRIDRWFFITEGPGAFYMIEIAYSPQTNESADTWTDLSHMMTSFRVFQR